MENPAKENASTNISAEGEASALLSTKFRILILLVFVEGFGGAITNILSLSYFLNKDRKSLASKLMILLNTTDALVCISALIVLILLVMAAVGKLPLHIFLVTAPWFQLLVGATAFSTALLSITRTISLLRPFYQINQKVIALSIALYWIYVLLIYFPLYSPMSEEVVDVYSMCELTLFILIVATCSVICMLKLRSDRNMPNTDQTRRRATVTILIISVLFCVVNMAYLSGVIYSQFILKAVAENGTVENVGDLFVTILYTVFVGVPLNSTINPLIYFARKKEMRAFINTTCSKFWCCCCRVKECREQTEKRKDTEMSV